MTADESSGKAGTTSEDPSSQNPAVVILSAEHGVLSCNHRVEALTGYTPQALAQLNLGDLFEPLCALNELLRQIHAGESPASIPLRLRRADGRRLPVDVHCEPLQSLKCSEGPLLMVIREVVMQKAQRHDDGSLARWGQLAGDVSHAIRNPMNAVFLHADIVEEEVRQPVSGDSTQVAQSLAIMKSELMRLFGLIQDFLFLPRLANLPRTPSDLRLLVEDVVYDVQAQAALRQVGIALHGLDELADVPVHESSFRRALHNMLQILIEAVPRHTTITLKGGRTSAHLHLQIHDLNRAIPPEVWAALQMSLRATTPEPTDLRPYIAQEIVAAHGGEITVCHDAKASLLCTVTLPLDAVG